MSDIAGKMAEWRKTVWGTGPCPDSSPENFTLTDEEREAISTAAWYLESMAGGDLAGRVMTTLRSLLERTRDESR